MHLDYSVNEVVTIQCNPHLQFSVIHIFVKKAVFRKSQMSHNFRPASSSLHNNVSSFRQLHVSLRKFVGYDLFNIYQNMYQSSHGVDCSMGNIFRVLFASVMSCKRVEYRKQKEWENISILQDFTMRQLVYLLA